MSKFTCSDCKYCDVSMNKRELAICRKNPPLPDMHERWSLWPDVNKYIDWCGSFELNSISMKDMDS